MQKLVVLGFCAGLGVALNQNNDMFYYQNVCCNSCQYVRRKDTAMCGALCRKCIGGRLTGRPSLRYLGTGDRGFRNRGVGFYEDFSDFKDTVRIPFDTPDYPDNPYEEDYDFGDEFDEEDDDFDFIQFPDVDEHIDVPLPAIQRPEDSQRRRFRSDEGPRRRNDDFASGEEDPFLDFSSPLGGDRSKQKVRVKSLRTTKNTVAVKTKQRGIRNAIGVRNLAEAGERRWTDGELLDEFLRRRNQPKDEGVDADKDNDEPVISPLSADRSLASPPVSNLADFIRHEYRLRDNYPDSNIVQPVFPILTPVLRNTNEGDTERVTEDENIFRKGRLLGKGICCGQCLQLPSLEIEDCARTCRPCALSGRRNRLGDLIQSIDESPVQRPRGSIRRLTRYWLGPTSQTGNFPRHITPIQGVKNPMYNPSRQHIQALSHTGWRSSYYQSPQYRYTP